ncbi:MAG: CRISPR system precrRNA processing endoribonuclease RAMP protein Cas6, partial [Zoogloeaceae bacterium]|nr:CRISPR system precrRNA processing endoribonuclease RAMP protein Cas6 [Zoogloeaceae bacterium]
DFLVETPLFLPAYAGSTLRGAFGGAFRAASCIARQKTCDACPLMHSCPYAIVFETRPPEKAVGLLQKFSHVPHPYVIEPPQWGERNYAPGERLSFHLVLAGRAIAQLALIIHAFTRAFLRGVGKGEGTARLETVTHLGEAARVILDGSQGALLEHDMTLPAAPVLGDVARLDFTSPLRLQRNGHPIDARQLVARDLLMALVRRVALIHEFHGAGPLALDFTKLAGQAEKVESEKDLRWRDWMRYSSRQQQKMALGGVVGAWTLRGDLAPFAEFLHLGEWLHVGKEATFGLGGYLLSRD